MAWSVMDFPDGAAGITRVVVKTYYAVHIDFDADIATQLAKAIPMLRTAVRAEARSPSVFPTMTEPNLIVKMQPLERFLNPLAKSGGVLTISIDFDIEIDITINIV
jgi:hypothetical protein